MFGAPVVKFTRSKLGIEKTPFYGIMFVFIGILFSQTGLNIFTDDVLLQILPIIGFSLGWLGFLITIDFDVRLIKKIDTRDIAYSLLFSGGAFLAVGIGFTLIFGTFLRGFPQSTAWLLAALSVATSPILLRLMIRKERKRSFKIEQLSLITVLGGILGVLVYGIITCFLEQHAWWRNLGLALVIGISSGLFINMMVIGARKHNEMLLFVYGIIFLSSGLSGLLKISPLFVNAITGIVVANSSLKRSRVAAILNEAEQLMMVLIYVLFGALWSVRLENMKQILLPALIIGFIYFLLRYFGKLFGSFLIKIFSGENTFALAGSLLCQTSVLFAALIDFRMLGASSAFIMNRLFLALFVSVLVAMPAARYFMEAYLKKDFQRNV